MSLTPLHYYSEAHHDGPQYGESLYTTDCGRFQVGKFHMVDCPEGWMIDESWLKDVNVDRWQMWLESIGLIGVIFPTRREALAVLTDALLSDGFMDTPAYEQLVDTV